MPEILKHAAAITVRADFTVLLLATLLGELPRFATAQQASLQGIVLSSRTGSPIEGVAVLLEAGDQRRYTALTDRNGFYQIGQIRPGMYTLLAQQLGYCPWRHMHQWYYGPGKSPAFTSHR